MGNCNFAWISKQNVAIDAEETLKYGQPKVKIQ